MWSKEITCKTKKKKKITSCALHRARCAHGFNKALRQDLTNRQSKTHPLTCHTTIPPPCCPPRKRWSCCFRSPSRPTPGGTWCWAALDGNDRAWRRRKRKRFHYLFSAESLERGELPVRRALHLPSFSAPASRRRRVDRWIYGDLSGGRKMTKIKNDSRGGCLEESPHPAFLPRFHVSVPQ